MIFRAKDMKKSKSDAVWIWCIGEGYEQDENKSNFLDAFFLRMEKQQGIFLNLIKQLMICSLVSKRQKKRVSTFT